MYKPACSDDKPVVFHEQAGRVLRTGLPCSDPQPCMLHTHCVKLLIFSIKTQHSVAGFRAFCTQICPDSRPSLDKRVLMLYLCIRQT